jgi:hypothetical protein
MHYPDDTMTRIVTSTYRYKRPSPKRKAQAAEIPQAVVKARKPKSRHVVQLEEARAELPETEPPANDDRKSAIVTTVSRKRSRLRRIEQALARRASSGDSSE